MQPSFFSRLSGAALAAALLMSPAFAQQPAPAAPPRLAPPPPAAGLPQLAPPTPAGTIPIPQATPAHLAAARDIVIRSGMSRNFDAAIPNLTRQLNANVTRTRPELVKDMKETIDKLQPEFAKLTEDMIMNATRVYTALLNEQECKDVANFFKSPLGTKFINMQPLIFDNLSDVMEPWNRHVAQVMFEMARDEMKKKGHQI